MARSACPLAWALLVHVVVIGDLLAGGENLHQRHQSLATVGGRGLARHRVLEQLREDKITQDQWRCGKFKIADCDFMFDTGPTFSPPVLTAKSGYTSPPLKHRKGKPEYASFYINSTARAPCNTTSVAGSCSAFGVLGGSKTPKKAPPVQVTLAAKDWLSTIKGGCFQLYFGEFAVREGKGSQTRKWITWTDPNQYYPKDRRCILFQVSA